MTQSDRGHFLNCVAMSEFVMRWNKRLLGA